MANTTEIGTLRPPPPSPPSTTPRPFFYLCLISHTLISRSCKSYSRLLPRLQLESNTTPGSFHHSRREETVHLQVIQWWNCKTMVVNSRSQHFEPKELNIPQCGRRQICYLKRRVPLNKLLNCLCFSHYCLEVIQFQRQLVSLETLQHSLVISHKLLW